MALENTLVGQKRFVIAWDEDPDATTSGAWGTKPVSPSTFLLPLDTCDVNLRKDRRNNKPYFGQFATKHGRSYRGMPQGNMAGALHGYKPANLSISIAEWLFNQALNDPTATEINSFGIEDVQGPDLTNKQINGLRFNTFTLQGSESSGRVEWSGDVMGKSESQVDTTSYSVPDDMEKLLDFEFQDVTFELDLAGGTSWTEWKIDSFNLTCNNGLKPKYLNSRTPTMLKRTMRDRNFQVVIPKHVDTWDDYARVLTSDAEPSARLTLLGLHNGTLSNAYTKVIIVFPRLQLVSGPQDRWAVEDYAMQTLDFQCLKPDTSTNELTHTWSTQA